MKTPHDLMIYIKMQLSLTVTQLSVGTSWKLKSTNWEQKISYSKLSLPLHLLFKELIEEKYFVFYKFFCNKNAWKEMLLVKKTILFYFSV